MSLHVLDNLIDVGFHTLHFLVLFREETGLALGILFFILLIHIDWLHHGLIAQYCFLFGFNLFDSHVRPSGEFFNSWSPVVVLEVVIDVYKRELSHAFSIQNLWVFEPLRCGERCLLGDLVDPPRFKHLMSLVDVRSKRLFWNQLVVSQFNYLTWLDSELFEHNGWSRALFDA